LNTPFHFAAFAGNFLIVEHLLMMGVDLHLQTIDHVLLEVSENSRSNGGRNASNFGA
jgi:ankyrin repeat protein